MTRPSGSAWEPLGLDQDPVPGDPDVITTEAQYLASVSSQLATQIAALRRIASSPENAGATADKIRTAASGLVGGLTTVHDRYQQVSSALSGWVPQLNQAQSWSIQALTEAEGPYAKLKSTPQPSGINTITGTNGLPVLPIGAAPLNPVKQQEFNEYQSAMQKAQGELASAQALLTKATNLRDTEGSHYASLINNASNDSLKDSWWDRFKNWVDDHADLLKEIASILQDIVAVLAVICLLIPGVDLLIIAAMAVTALLLIVHTMLAATGNGSWLDVALDVVGLVTLGFGLGAANEVEGLESGARSAASEAWESDAKSMLEEGDYKDALDLFRSQTDEDGSLTRIGQIGVKLTMQAMKEALPEMPEEASEASSFWGKTASQFSSNWSTWGSGSKIVDAFTSGGDPGIATAKSSIDTLAQNYSTVTKVTDAAASASSTIRWANVAFYGGNVGVLGDYGLHLRLGDGYDKWKEAHSSYTLSTTEANVLADIPGDLPFEGFKLASSFIGN